MKLSITAEHIRYGFTDTDPISMAINEKIRTDNVRARTDSVGNLVVIRQGKRDLVIPLPNQARKLLRRWDAGEDCEPIELDIPLEENEIW